jgi:calreticulin
LYAYESFAFVGIEIWQVKAGSVFGNILVTDDVELAKTEADAILERVQAERDLETAADEAARQKEADDAKAATEEQEEKEDL